MQTITDHQIERGLTDPDVCVRVAWAQRHDFQPTPQQVERGLTDANSGVRYAWAKRPEE